MALAPSCSDAIVKPVRRTAPSETAPRGGTKSDAATKSESRLRTMLRIRLFETKLNELFSRGAVRGTVHLCVGQEAVPTGVSAALRADDWVSATHRGHGAAIARGLSLYRLFAEIFGRKDGYCAGRGGSQHIACMGKGFLGTNGISGGGLPIATGAALTAQRLGQDRVAVAFFGDGVANQGVFHESLNMAAIWRLPIVYVCENNLYAMSAPASAFVAGGNIARRAEAYGMRHATIDGNDVDAVEDVASELIASARAGRGPSLLECMTYRRLGHSKSDKCAYRTREEEVEWTRRDPIVRCKELLIERSGLSADELAAIERDVCTEVESAAERAMACPAVDASTLHDHLA